MKRIYCAQIIPPGGTCAPKESDDKEIFVYYADDYPQARQRARKYFWRKNKLKLSVLGYRLVVEEYDRIEDSFNGYNDSNVIQGEFGK